MVKFNETNRTWSASVCLRHPLTKTPTSMRRDGLQSERQAVLLEKQLRDTIYMKFRQSLEPKWPRLFAEYCVELKTRDISEKTKSTYIGCLKSAVGNDWDDRFVKDITPEDIKYVVRHKNKHYSESHRKSLRKFFNSIFEFALLKKYVVTNPMPPFKFTIGQKIETTLNQKQCGELLKLASEQRHEFYPVWFVALHTGMRNGELYSLRWSNVDFERRIIKCSCTWQKGQGFIDYTKTGDDRIIPMNLQLERFLKILHFNSCDQYVLPRLKKWENGEQAKILRTFLRSNNMPEMRFHDFRATCATLLLSNGVSLAAVMNILGWKQLKTANIYYRKSAVDIAGATDKLIF